MQGGNGTLSAEKSKSWTVGFAMQPTANWTVGVDWWDYYIKDSISVIGEQSIFADPTKYANLYVRCSQASPALQASLGACNTPGGDPLAYVINTFLNLGDVSTNGVDVSVAYNSGPTSAGRFNASLRGTYVNKYEFQVEPGGIWYNPVGNYNPQFAGPVIRYQQILTFGWDTGPWSTLLSNRYQSGYLDQNGANQGRTVNSYSTFDVSVSYTGFKGVTLQAGILNLLDQDPPFTNQTSRFQARGYDDRFSNPLGRTWQVSGRYEF